MSHFIVIFFRDQPRTSTAVERIEDADEALMRLFTLESEFRHDPERGVVMLVADDEETIRTTHSQYFKTLDELLDVSKA